MWWTKNKQKEAKSGQIIWWEKREQKKKERKKITDEQKR